MKFNVVCIECGNAFVPEARTPLWWKAKQHNDRGVLSAMACSGVECGCIKERYVYKPEAPFRVYGYTIECDDYDVPFDTFAGAVKQYLHCKQNCDNVFISGVSSVLQKHLDLMPRRRRAA